MLDKDGDEVFQQVSTSDYISFAYKEYGRQVLQHRQIPYIYDGLKDVYRHVIQASYELPDKMTKVVAIVGDCLKKYHFTGDASVAPVVSELVNQGILLGQGNHGNLVMRGQDDPPAAPRYVEAKLNPVIRKQLDKILPSAAHMKTVTGYDEYEFIPTPIPMSLVFGATGIALGIKANIPAFTVDSLYEAYINKDYKLLRSNYGYEIDNSSWPEVEKIWKTGIGKLTLNIPFNKTTIEGDAGFLISCTPKIFKPKLKTLENWEKMGWLSIEDISDSVPKLFVHRTKRTRQISDEDIEKELRNACQDDFFAKCIVFDGEVTRPIGIYDWVDVVYKNYSSLYTKYKSNITQILDHDIRLWKNFRRVAEYYLNNCPLSAAEIANEINSDPNIEDKDKINESIVKEIGIKSISTLRDADPEKKVDDLQEKLKEHKKLDISKEIKDFVGSWSANGRK